MRLVFVIAVALVLAACSSAAPAVGPPLQATAAPPARPHAIDARLQGVVMTASGARSAGAEISRQIVDGLVLVCWLAPAEPGPGANPSARLPPGRPLVAAELGAVGLDAASALSLAEDNLRAGLRPAGAVLEPLPAAGIGVDAGDFGEAGRIALIDEWSPLAQSMAGQLLVALPAADTVLYTDARSPGALAALRARAASVMAQSPRPISAAVLRWSDTGWQLAGAPADGSQDGR